jgi:hypothetical protein
MLGRALPLPFDADEVNRRRVDQRQSSRDAPMAVVDDQLRVRSLSGLRVADASIMPTLMSGNTNAPCIMIGEKASDLVLAASAA